MTNIKIEFETCPGDAVRILLEKMLESGIVRAAALPVESPGKAKIDYCLVGSRESLEKARPVAPYFFGNRALAVSRLTRLGEIPERTAVLLRPCEVRSFVELKKLKQINDENLIIICMDCPGTLSAKEFREKTSEEFDFHPRIVSAYAGGEDLEGEREACSICLYPALEDELDIHAGLFGQHGCVLFIPASSRGEEVISKTGFDEAGPEEMNARKEALDKLKAKRKQSREEWFGRLTFETGGILELARHFDACEQCRACSEICPVCYCKQCAFKLASMETQPENNFLKALNLKKIPLPSSPLFFHLGRMTHVAHSCTACGACSEACPAGIDVGKAFIAAGRSVQETFDYEPGRSSEDDLPLIAYKEDELEEKIR